MVVTSLGTPWEIETQGKILFLEDVNEKPYRIDRMLMHLLLAGKFRGVRGIVFGAMLGCSARRRRRDAAAQMVRVLGGLGVPIVIGFPSGHVESGNITLPFGVPAALASSTAGVRLQVEPATFVAFRIQNHKGTLRIDEGSEHPSDRNLRYGHGLAGGDAEGCAGSMCAAPTAPHIRRCPPFWNRWGFR